MSDMSITVIYQEQKIYQFH